MNNTLVVTGWRGFIGTNFMGVVRDTVTSYKSVFNEIILIDSNELCEWNLEESDALALEISSDIPTSVITKDINNLSTSLKSQPRNVTVLNFASESHVDTSITHPTEVFIANCSLVPNLINILGAENIDRFIQIRTDEEYGDLPSALSPAFNVDSPIQPRNPYSASKAAQTLFLQSMENTLDMKVVYVVLSNQYGKYQHPSKFIPNVISRSIHGEPAHIYGSGANLREWTFVEDTVGILSDIVLDAEFGDRVNHITNPDGLMNNIRVAELIMKEIDTPVSMDFVPDRNGHDFCYKLKPTIIRDMTPFYEGIKKTVDFYKTNFK